MWELGDRRKPQQPCSFQTPCGLLGGRGRGSRFGTRHPGECGHSLHARFPGRTRLLSGETQASVAKRNQKIMGMRMIEYHDAMVRVRYAETAQTGVVYHANYLVWVQAGRAELTRALGFTYTRIRS